ncbi:degenerin deg-1-like isoform X1 [Haliotis rufescens]|uniref:degenerin deg-1-like isoform X1 n=1 Tax=Haliotis rufescens TaxID=6454 RepID=UPI00201EA937|nr:degenerin deg-1-like isoform X1 [Haliotis rufescens]
MDNFGFSYRDRVYYHDRPTSQLSGSYDPHYKMSKSENSEPEEEPKKTAKSVSAEFADMTSMMGVNYIHHSRRLWAKGFWLFIVLGGCGAMIFHLYYLCSVFFAFPKQTKIVLGFDSLRFPAVTVCNINPIRGSKLAESGPLMQTLMQNTNTTNLIRFFNETDLGNGNPAATQPGSTQAQSGSTPGTGSTLASGPGSTQASRTRSTQASRTRSTQASRPQSSPPPGSSTGKRRRKRYLDDFTVNVTNSYLNISDSLRDDYNDDWERASPRTTESRIEHEFEDLYSKIPRGKRIQIGHQLKDFMVKSSFSGRTIKSNNYIVHPSMTYGNCFTLQYPDFVSRKSGPVDGVEMVLFLENYEYLRGWTNGNGAHLVVHDRSTVPLVEQDGVAISGGTETFIGLKRVNIERLHTPYGLCDDGTEFRSRFNITYTRQACQDYCLVRFIVDSCGCYDGRQGEINMIFRISDVRDCKTQTEIQCVIKIEKDFEFGRLSSQCTCYSPCVESLFEKSISSRQWPSVEYGKVLVEAICARSDAEHCRKLREYDGFRLSQNFIKLNIFYEDLNYENITEEADYAEAQFLSDIGGTLGLWIGLSVISIFEIGQFFVEIMGVCFARCGASTDSRRTNPRVRSETSTSKPRYPDYQTRSDYARSQNGDYRASYGH